MKNLFYIFLFLSFAGGIFAGNNDKVKPVMKNISGKVIAVNGEEIAAAKIVVLETNEVFYADLDGNFKLSVKTDKAYSLSVQSIGYAPLIIKSSEIGHFSELQLQEF